MSRYQNKRPNQKQQQFTYVVKGAEDIEEQRPVQIEQKNQQQTQETNNQNKQQDFKRETQKQRKPENQDSHTHSNGDYQKKSQQETKYDQPRQKKYKDNDSERPSQQRQYPQQQARQKHRQIDDDYKREPELIGDEELFDINKIQHKELAQVLIKMFKQKKIDCPVCMKKIYGDNKVWNCIQCYQPFHLGCMHKWITNSNQKNTQLFNWSCPKCNLLYQDQLPIYSCFCGKVKEPEFDKYGVPHACQQKCNKKRGKQCPHPCPMDCHPGPCPECHVQGVDITCYCGKTNKQISCSDSKQVFACNQICGKLICDKHYCQKNCHPGSCDPCKEIKQIQCYCGSQTSDVNCAVNGYSCKKPCEKLLDCGNHKCQELCHEKCKECLLKPELVLTCPCGAFELKDNVERKSCLDPIPSCGRIVVKVLDCGHKGRTVCGQPFPPCSTKVKVKCRCGDEEQITACSDQEEFKCDNVCKKKKSCRIHYCAIECCPPDAQQQGLHLCMKVCGKPLACQKHTCELFCHLGQCQPCPITITQPITCPCGKSVILPPQKCGTQPPSCYETCGKQLECGHKCLSRCHQGNCTPCQEQVVKQCRCKSQEMTISCSKTAVCHSVCGKTLTCGHKCPEICQEQEVCPLDLAENCGQKCSAKKICGHYCQEICHPGQECPKQPCKTMLRVVCSCGNRDTFMQCGVIDQPEEKTLKCDQKCQNIKRFGAFYKSNNLVEIEKTYFPDILLKYAHYNMQPLQKLEEKVEQYLVNSPPNEGYNFNFPRSEWSELKRLALQILFSRHYKFDVQVCKPLNKQYSFSLFKTEDTLIPKVKLSEYYIKVQKGVVKRDHSPFKAKLKTIHDFTTNEIQVIENQLSDYKNDFYSERQGQYWVFMFWEEAQAEQVQKKLKRMVGQFNVQWTIELNQQALDEDRRVQEEADSSDIIIKPKVINLKAQQQYEDSDLSIEYDAQTLAEFAKLRDQYKEQAQELNMCDEEEVEERISKSQLSIFEQDPFYQYEIRPKNEWMVREYRRIIQKFTPSYLRSPDTLIKVTDFLVLNFIDADSPQKDFKKPAKGESFRNITYEDIWQYINDRLLQVRIEANQLDFKDINVKLARFYCISHSQLQDNKDNLKQLTIIVNQSSNPELLRYSLILQCFLNDDVNILEALIQQQVNPSEFANLFQLIIECRSGNQQKFIEYYKQTNDILLKSLMHGFIPTIQSKLLEKLMKAHITLDLEQFRQQMGLASLEESIQFLKSLKLDISKTEEELKRYVSEQENKIMPLIYFQPGQQIDKIPFSELQFNRVLAYK